MFKKSFLIKIPLYISVYIDPQKKSLLLKNLIKFSSKIIKIKDYKSKITFLYITFFSNNKKTFVKSQQKNVIRFLKKVINETTFKNYKKLKLNGIGYKILIIKTKSNNCILHFKLGYSHSIYFRLPDNIIVKLNKTNSLFLFSFSIEKLSLITSLIKKCKIPDPYKGKGFLYENEKITLKIGKKS